MPKNNTLRCTALLSPLMWLFCCCSVCRQMPVSTSDSTRVEVVTRQVVVYDTVEVEVPQYSALAIVQDSSFLSNDMAQSQAKILPDGELYHTLEIVPQTLHKPTLTVVDVRDSIIYRERIVSRVLERERSLTWWQQFKMRGFYLLLVGAILQVVIFIRLR